MDQTEWDSLVTFIAREIIEMVVKGDPSVKVDNSAGIAARAVSAVMTKNLNKQVTDKIREYLNLQEM